MASFYCHWALSCCNQALWGLLSTKDLQPFTAGGSQIWPRYLPEWFSKILARPQTLYYSAFCECIWFKAKMGGDGIVSAIISNWSALVLLAIDKVSSWLAIDALNKGKVMKFNFKLWPNSAEFNGKVFHFKWICENIKFCINKHLYLWITIDKVASMTSSKSFLV